MGRQAKAKNGLEMAASVWRALDKIVSDDVTRENLQYVEVEHIAVDGQARAILRATDGKCAVVVTVTGKRAEILLRDVPVGQKRYTRPGDAARRADIAAPYAWETDAGRMQFPDVNLVVPDRNNEKCAVSAFDPALLARVLVTMEKIHKAVDALCAFCVRVQLGQDGFSPARVDGSSYECKIIGVVMPMRMKVTT